jgi:hypothetical protein
VLRICCHDRLQTTLLCLNPTHPRQQDFKLNTFELLARAWVASAKKDRQWSNGYADKVIRHLEIHTFPWIGERPIEMIAPTEIVRCLHRIKDRGNLEPLFFTRGSSQ